MNHIVPVVAGVFAVGFFCFLAKLLLSNGSGRSGPMFGGGGLSEPEPRHPQTVNPPRTQDAE
jgi:hypothetical protein